MSRTAALFGGLKTLRCPVCGQRDTRVVDSRELDDSAVRRRRECPACGSRFTTYERPESARLTVVKRKGGRQEFDRRRLLGGIERSLAGRPVPAGAAQDAVERIEAGLRSRGTSEVDSTTIGELVIEELAAIDRVASVRFAMHFRDDLTDDQLEALVRGAEERAGRGEE